jgi:hypothetical protein
MGEPRPPSLVVAFERGGSSSFELSTANLSLEDGEPKNPPDGLAEGDVCLANDFKLLLLRNTPVFRTTCPIRLVDSSILLIPSTGQTCTSHLELLFTPLHLLESVFDRPDLVGICETWSLDFQIDSRRHRPSFVSTFFIPLKISSDQSNAPTD